MSTRSPGGPRGVRVPGGIGRGPLAFLPAALLLAALPAPAPADGTAPPRTPPAGAPRGGGGSAPAGGRGAEPAGAPAPPAAAPAPRGGAIAVVARSIGSRRPDPPQRRAHAALLVRFGGRRDGFVVQGGPQPEAGGRTRLAGWVIPSPDPAADFGRAAGAWWGEPGVRELPTRELAALALPELGEAELRARVEALNEELRGLDYRLSGPSSNSFVSLLLQRLGVPLPAVGDADLPGWGWRP